MIDTRILEMVFQNKGFQKGVDQSIDSLHELDKSVDKLDGKNGSKALETIGSAAEQVSAKFSAMQIMAYSVLSNITNRAVDAGINLVKSLSVDQVMAGWEKYNNKNSSMQTILNNAHKADGSAYELEEVNDEMDKLIWFTDETSYRFTDMVDNIGKFTSMGKDLESSVTAMQGISVWASSAGQGVNEASRAMYNLSQAMGAGALKLQDWKSIQNANMATEEFKNLALEEGAAMGALDKKYDEATKKWKYFIAETENEVSLSNFDQTLSEGWFDSNVLMDVLNEYGKFATKLRETVEGSGLEATPLMGILTGRTSFDKEGVDNYINAADKIEWLTRYVEQEGIVFADAEYTIESFAAELEILNSEEYALSKKAFQAAQETKTLAEAIDATKEAVASRWSQIFELIFGNYEEAKKVWSELAERLYDAFTPALDGIIETLEVWRELNDEDAGSRGYFISSIWQLWDAISSLKEIASDAWAEIFGERDAEADSLRFANAIIFIGNSIQKFEDFITENGETFSSVFKAIFSTIKVGTTIITSALSAIKNFISGMLEGFGGPALSGIKSFADMIYDFNMMLLDGNIENFFSGLGENMLFLKAPLDAVVGLFGALFERLKFIPEYLSAASNKIGEFVRYFKILWTAFDAINGFKKLTLRDIFTDDYDGVGKLVGTLYILVQRLKGIPELFVGAKNTIAEFFSTFKKEKDVINGTNEALEQTTTVMGVVASVAGNIAGKIANMYGAIKEGDKSSGVMTKLVHFFLNLFKIIKAVFTVVKDLFLMIIDGFNKAFDNLTVESIIEMLKNGMLIAFIAKITKGLKEFFGIGSKAGGLLESLSGVFEGVGDAINNFKKQTDVKIFKNIAVSLLILAAAILILSTIDPLKLATATAAIVATIMAISKSMMVLSKDLKENLALKQISKTLIKMASAVFILALAVKTIGSMDLGDLAKGLLSIIVLLAAMSGAMILLSRFAKEGKVGAAMMLAMAAAIVILSKAVTTLGAMDQSSLIKGILASVTLIAAMTGSMIALSSFAQKGAKGARAMLAMAAAVAVLSLSVYILGKMDVDTLVKGVAAVGILLFEFGIFADAMGKTKGLIKTAGTMLVLASSMVIMAAAVNKMSKIDDDALQKALVALGLIFGGIVVFMTALKGTGSMMSTATSMLLLSIAMVTLAGAVQTLGEMSTGEMVQGLIGMAGALATIVLAMQFAPEGMIQGAAALLVVAAALLALVPTILILGNMDWGELIKSMVALVAIMAVFVGSMLLLKDVGPVILAAAGALALFGASILAVGAGLFLMAAGISMIVAVGEGAIALITALVAAIVMAIPAFIEAVGIGIVAFVKAIADSFDAIVGAVVTIISGILEAVIRLVPEIKDVLLALLQLVIEVAPKFFEAVKVVLSNLLDLLIEVTPKYLELIKLTLSGLLDMLIELTPKVIEWLGLLIGSTLEMLNENVPKFMELVGTLLTSLIKLITDTVPEFVTMAGTILNSMMEFMREFIPQFITLGLDILLSILKGIRDRIADIATTAIQIISEFINGIAAGIPSVIQAGFNLIISFINGLADAINNNSETLFDAVKNLFLAVISSVVTLFKNAWEDLRSAGHALMESGFIKGLKEKLSSIGDAAGEILTKIKTTLKAGWDNFKEIGGYLIDGLIEGIKSTFTKVKDAIIEFGEGVVSNVKSFFGINSPSRVFAEIGMYNMLGFAKGIDDYADVAEDAAEDAGKGTLEVFDNAMNQVFDMMNSDMDFSPTITPILDLSNVQNGGKTLSGMFSDVNVSATASASNKAANAKANTQASTANAIDAAIKKYTDKLTSVITNNKTDVDVSVTLEGDAAGIFKTVRTQNDRYKASTGRSALI